MKETDSSAAGIETSDETEKMAGYISSKYFCEYKKDAMSPWKSVRFLFCIREDR